VNIAEEPIQATHEGSGFRAWEGARVIKKESIQATHEGSGLRAWERV